MFKNIFIVIGIILALLFIVFGSYFPFLKARLYIQTINALSSVRSVAEFEDLFKKPLTFFSPIGQEEVVKFFAGDVASNVIARDNPENVARELISFTEPYLFQDNVRHLLIGGEFYNFLWRKYGQREEDFQKALDYYQRAFAIGPKLPPVLYNLLNLYQVKGDVGKEKEIAGLILKYWPSDQGVRDTVDKLK